MSDERIARVRNRPDLGCLLSVGTIGITVLNSIYQAYQGLKASHTGRIYIPDEDTGFHGTFITKEEWRKRTEERERNFASYDM